MVQWLDHGFSFLPVGICAFVFIQRACLFRNKAHCGQWDLLSGECEQVILSEDSPAEVIPRYTRGLTAQEIMDLLLENWAQEGSVNPYSWNQISI